MNDDDFGWSPEDEEELVAVTAEVSTGGKRKLPWQANSKSVSSPDKRPRPGRPTPGYSTASSSTVLPKKVPQERFASNVSGDLTITTPSPNTALASKILKDRFALNSFRLEQEGAITRILDGGSAVVVFPTGGGKSLCYQVCDLTLHTDM
jgi:ATP-dependent helicase YprA (DUF1998 family)